MKDNGITNEMAQGMIDLGYAVRSGDVHMLPGLIMSPAGPGIPEPLDGQYVQVLHDRIRVYEAEFVGEPYTPRSYYDTRTVAMFDSVAAFEEWCRAHGQRSERGQPAFAQGMHDG